MNKLTQVSIPENKTGLKDEYIDWCMTNVSPYSTEITWIAKKIPAANTIANRNRRWPPVAYIFTFGNAEDATAFKLRFAL
jgi:hypothetical protein